MGSAPGEFKLREGVITIECRRADGEVFVDDTGTGK
jgi:hypothetical protein